MQGIDQIKDQGEIAREFDILSSALADLEKTIEEHGQKIEGAMSQSLPEAEVETKNGEVTSPVAVRIKNDREIMQKLTRRIVGFTRRVEL